MSQFCRLPIGVVNLEGATVELVRLQRMMDDRMITRSRTRVRCGSPRMQ